MVKKTKTSAINITPLGDRVVIKRDESGGEKTISGIIIPDTTQGEKPSIGVVVAAGGGRVNDNGETIPLIISVGDKVIFSRFGGDEVEMSGETYLIISESNILAVIK